jgi:hypothetical protein
MNKNQSPPSYVTDSQIYGWRTRLRDIGEHIRTLEVEREKLEKLISMAEELAREAELLEAASDSERPLAKVLSSLSSNENFPKAVMVIVEHALDGITYPEIREAILQSPLAERLRTSDKGFYHALGRAKDKGTIVEHRGHVFTPENLNIFQRKVAAGLKQDKTKPSSFGSPLMDAIQRVIANNPGVIAKEVIDMVKDGSKDQGLEPVKNEGSAYNAIARLKERGIIEGFGPQDRQLRIGPEAPESIKRLANMGVVVHLAKKDEASNERVARRLI